MITAQGAEQRCNAKEWQYHSNWISDANFLALCLEMILRIELRLGLYPIALINF